jgi:mannitol/fructose-specific phosphotransferase system IIA component (Ntr-type)
MSRDGLLPQMLGHSSLRFRTPYVSVLVTSGFMILVITLLTVEDLVKVASTMLLVLYQLSCLSVLIMRGSRIQNYRPLFRAPLHPWLEIVGIGCYVLLIVDMGLLPLVTTGVFALGGLVWYLAYVRPRSQRECALVFWVRKIVSGQIARAGLEDELRQIALERDEIQHDRFDRLVQQCEILDIEQPLDSGGLFSLLAEAMADKLQMSPTSLQEGLIARERQSSTVVQPGLAIPHVIVSGRNKFDLAIVRCRAGVSFAGHDEPVRVVFALIGSEDQRNYHLRALMAIAHITQAHDFASRWLAAPKAEHLRDLVLMAERRREPHL